MSALPQDADRRDPGHETELLVDALQSQAAARDYANASDARIRQAIEQNAEQIVYRWQTPNQREADMQIYFRRSEDVDLLAVQLLRIDYRQPTIQERARSEEEFEAELSAAGDLWLDVSSHIAG